MNLIEPLKLQSNKLSLSWICLGILALSISGILSLALVFARAPIMSSFFSTLFPFKTILIAHVNLSVLVWLLSVTASIWSIFLKESIRYYGKILVWLAWGGVMLIAISPLVPGSDAISNNYIPILTNLPFILGLACYLVSVLLTGIIVFVCYIFDKLTIKDDFYIASTSSFIIIIAFFCFLMSYVSLENITIKQFDPYYYYEILFWGGGHILQFLYVQMAGFIWIILAHNIFSPQQKFNVLYKIYFILNLLLTLPSLIIYWFVNIDDSLYIEFFTLQMKYLGGIMPGLLILTLGFEYCKAKYFPNNKAHISSSNTLIPILINALAYSIIVFLVGGVIGILISGTNVTIPAHYHGSIVGISIGFMGYTYFYLSNIGYKHFIEKNYFPAVQPIIYGVGQLLHIIGLSVAGGYGALRKTPGVEMVLKAKIGMGIMGIGGIIAIIGGLLFVVICVKSLAQGCIQSKHQLK